MQTQRRSTDSTVRFVDDLAAALPATVTSDVAAPAARLMARTEAMGLVTFDTGHALSPDLFGEALDALLRAGIGRQLVRIDDVRTNPRGALELLNESIAASPHPATEWGSVADVLGPELTARLVGVSGSSLRRYTTGERTTPDAVAARLHFLALVIADLMGSYNPYGVRRWFERARRPLGGKAPAELLTGDWDPDEAAPRQIADLAGSLTSLGAT